MLTSAEVATLLRVHPKHVYRLLRDGLPARRVGGEWRFVRADVLEWSKTGASASSDASAVSGASEAADGPGSIRRNDERRIVAPPLLAANGDVAVELLLQRLCERTSTPLGFVSADRDTGLELLARRKVLAAGTHGLVPPRDLAGDRLVQIHLVRRAIGLVTRKGDKPRTLAKLGKTRLASRPATAGVRLHLDAALRAEGLDPQLVHERAVLYASHRDVVCSIAAGAADLGIASAAWAARLDLAFTPMVDEPYGLTLFAEDLGDPRVVQLCELAQSASFRSALSAVPGYVAEGSGSIHYEVID